MSRFRGSPRFGGPGPGGPPRHPMRGGGPPRGGPGGGPPRGGPGGGPPRGGPGGGPPRGGSPQRGGRGGFQHSGRQPQNMMTGSPGPRGPSGPPRGGFQNNNFRGRGNFRGGNNMNNRGPPPNLPSSSSSVKVEKKDQNPQAIKEEPKVKEEQGKKAEVAKTDKPAEANNPTTVNPATSSEAVPEVEAPKVDPPAEESVPHLTEVYISEYLCDLYLDVDKDGVTGSPKSTSGFDCLWASLRATHGVSGGKQLTDVLIGEPITAQCSKRILRSYVWPQCMVAFEVLALENTTTSTEHNACVLRVGWSHDDIDISLGENGTSWGYGGTAKKSHDNKYISYGDKYGAGDAIVCYIDLESNDKTISFAKNGKNLGTAFKLTADQIKKPLFPSVSTKNIKFLLNFGQQPTKQPLLDGYKMIAFTPANQIHPCIAGPATLAEAEFIMMVGLPAAGKSTWCESHAAAHPDKRYNILGTNLIMEKMKITGLARKRNYHGRWEELIKKATGILNTLFKVVEQKLERFPRNIILDQTNVYESARRRKLRNFSTFGRKVAVVIVNSGEELIKRNAKREKEEGKFVPESAVMEMKANFRTPVLSEGLTEIQFIEMDEGAAKKQIDDFQIEGKKYKDRDSRRSETERSAKPGEKRMPEKPPFEDKLNKRVKPDNEPFRSDGGRQQRSSSRDGDRSRSGPDRSSRPFDNRRRDSDRRDDDRRDDRDRRGGGGGPRGGMSGDRRDSDRRRSPDRGRSGDRGGRGDQSGRFDRRNDRDDRDNHRGRDNRRGGDDRRSGEDRRGGDDRFGGRDSDVRDGSFNRDRGGFRGGNSRGRDFGRGDARGGRDDRDRPDFGGNQNNNQSRWSDRNQPPAPSHGQDNRQGGWSQSNPDQQSNNQYGGPPNIQPGGPRGYPFGGNNNNSFNKPEIKPEPMDIGNSAGNQYPPNNNRNFPPVKQEPRMNNVSLQNNKSFGSTMTDYNTPETKQYGVSQDHNASYSNNDNYGQQGGYQQRSNRYGDQGTSSGGQQYGSLNNDKTYKNQHLDGYNQSGGFNNQLSQGFNQQSKGDTGGWNQGGGPGGKFKQPDSNRGGSGQSQPGSYDLSNLSSRFGQQVQSSQGNSGGSAGYDKGRNSGFGPTSDRSSEFGTSKQYPQPQQAPIYDSGQYDGQSYGQADQKSGYQRQSHSYSDNQRLGYDDNARQGYGDSNRKSFGDSHSSSFGRGHEDSKKQKLDSQRGSSYGENQLQGSGDFPRQSYGQGDTQTQGYGSTPSQSYGDTSRKSYGDGLRKGYGNSSSQPNLNDNSSRQGFGGSQARQSFGETQRPSYGDPQRQSNGNSYTQAYGEGGREGFPKREEPRSGSFGENQPAYQSYNTALPSTNPVPPDLKESVSQIFQNYGSQLNAVGARSASQESDHGIQRYTSKQPQGTELSYGTHQSYGAQQYSNTPAVQQYTAAPNSSQGQRGGEQSGYQQYPAQIQYQSYPGYQ